jgi:hypothetical protein
MVDLNGRLRLHPDFRHEVVRIGNDAAPVLVVDNFLSDPETVREYVFESGVFKPGYASYPGMQSVVPAIYVHALRLFLVEILKPVFGLENAQLAKAFSGFSLVTTRPEKLELVQRLPHFDTTDRQQIALLHYICPPGKGGTAFYRHRATGYEYVDETRVANYTDAVKAELRELGTPPARYVNATTAQYERIASFEPAFNRVLIYRSTTLHSADIAEDFDFDPDPRTGRLTVNALFNFA